MGCFHLLAIVNYAVCTLLTYISVQIPVLNSLRYVLRSAISGSCGNSMFNVLEDLPCCFWKCYFLTWILVIRRIKWNYLTARLGKLYAYLLGHLAAWYKLLPKMVQANDVWGQPKVETPQFTPGPACVLMTYIWYNCLNSLTWPEHSYNQNYSCTSCSFILWKQNVFFVTKKWVWEMAPKATWALIFVCTYLSLTYSMFAFQEWAQ